MDMSAQALLNHPDPPAEDFFSEMRELYTKACTFCVLQAMAQEDLFTAFTHPTSATSVAKERGYSQGMLEHMCDICANSGFLTKKNELYQITPAAHTYLTKSSEYSQCASLKSMSFSLETLWFSLADRLHQGPFEFDQAQFYHDSSLPAMAASTLCGRIQDTIGEISSLKEFMQWRRILDIGGGHGLYAIALAAKNPQMTAIVQDFSEVTLLAEENIRSYGMEQQVKTLSGDYLECDLGEPQSYDMVFASSTPAGAMDIMSSRIAEILKPGGYFITVQPSEDNSDDVFSELEWLLWTFSGITEPKTVWKKKNPFPPPGFIEHLSGLGLSLIKTVVIQDPYRKGYTVTMLILKKDRSVEKLYS